MCIDNRLLLEHIPSRNHRCHLETSADCISCNYVTSLTCHLVSSNQTQSLIDALNSTSSVKIVVFKLMLVTTPLKYLYLTTVKQTFAKISGNDVIIDIGQQTISRSRTLRKTHSNEEVINLRKVEKCILFDMLRVCRYALLWTLIIQR